MEYIITENFLFKHKFAVYFTTEGRKYAEILQFKYGLYHQGVCLFRRFSPKTAIEEIEKLLNFCTL